MSNDTLARRIGYTVIIGAILVGSLWDWLTHKEPYYEIESFDTTNECTVFRITDGPANMENRSEIVFDGSCDVAREKYPHAEPWD